jgi:hypothetical protein
MSDHQTFRVSERDGAVRFDVDEAALATAIIEAATRLGLAIVYHTASQFDVLVPDRPAAERFGTAAGTVYRQWGAR